MRLAGVLRITLAAAIVPSLIGCAPRSRLNADCQWTNDPPRRIDPRNPPDQRHLTNDAMIAEELAIRYADIQRGHRSGHFAGIDEYVQTRERCMASLFALAAGNHGVQSQDVRQFAGVRRADFDLAVLLSFAMLYVLICNVLGRWIVARFPSDEGLPAVSANVIASGMASASGLMTFALWAAVWEMMRVGNTHMSYRVGRSPWSQHRIELFVAGIGLFFAITLFHYLKAGRTDTNPCRRGARRSGA